MADFIEGKNFRAEFEGFRKDVQEAKAVLQANLEKAVAVGDEALAATIRGTMSKLESAGLSTEGVKETVKELRTEQAVLEQNLKTSADILEVQRQQEKVAISRAEAEQRIAAAQERAANPTLLNQFYRQQPTPVDERLAAAAAQRPGAPGIIVPPSYSRGATAGEQLAAEDERRIRNAEILARLQQEEADAGQKMAAQWAANAKAQQEAKAAAAQEKAELDAQNAELLKQQKIQDAINKRLVEAEALTREAAAAGTTLSNSKEASLRKTPPGVPASAWGPAERAAVSQKIQATEYLSLAGREETANNQLGASFIRLGLQENQASNALRRHGALTTEYLQALARGETTVKEFGYQVGATIGKFAGWTAAAAATYGALGAVAEFGKGAIDASTGAERLSRTIETGFNTHTATRDIISLSQATNVSIAEASDAIFRYSRTFHDLPSATAAAQLGLSAFKLDQVSLADSVKASTAIVQQFGGGVSTLKTTYNELAAGQRLWNARITEMIPLLQKSTGAVKNAGGELDPLIQLGVYSQRITQLSGAQIGTAFYRSAATFLNPATTKGQTDRGVLQSLGVDPNQGWTKVLHDALIRSLSLSPNERSQLSNAIFGPQYGGRLAAIFNPQGIGTYRQITQSITPANTQNALQSELNKELGTTRERMKSFVNEMQRVGAAIGDSGLLSGMNFFISGLVTISSKFRGVAEGFAALPPGMKDTVVGLEAIGAALLFLNKTRFGQSLADLLHLSAIPGIGGSRESRVTNDLRVGTRAAQEAIAQQVIQSNSRLLALESEQNVIGKRRDAIGYQVAASAEDQVAKEKAIVALEEELSALERQQTKIQDERAAQLEVQTELTGIQTKLRKGQYSKEELNALSSRVGTGTLAAEEQTAGATTLMGRVTSGVKGVATGLIGFATSIDPLMAAMIGVPLILSSIASEEQAYKQQVAKLQAITSQKPSLQGEQQIKQLFQSGVDPEAIAKYNGALNRYVQAVNQQEDLWVKQGGLYRQMKLAFSRSVTSINQAITQLSGAGGDPSGYLDALLSQSNKQLEQGAQANSDRGEVYGLHGNDLKRAAANYLALAARFRDSSDTQGLQAVKTAQQAFLAAVDRNVTALSDAAQSAQTQQGQSRDLQGAVGAVRQGEQAVKEWAAAMDKRFRGHASWIKAVNEAAQQVEEQFGGKLKSAIDAQIQAIEATAAYRASQIGGFNPADDIARAEAALAGLQQAYAKAKAEGASWEVLQGLLTQIDTSMHDIAKQKIDLADSIAKAQGQLYISQVTGTGPGADMERARRTLTVAQQQLARDQAQGKDQATILGDAAAVNDAQRSLNQQLQSRSQQLDQQLAAFIESEYALQESQTTDPVKKARLELAAATRVLSTIKPGDFQSNQEYLTALNNQRAKVNDARNTLNEQIIQTDLRNLRFEHDIHQIGDQQYINGLRNILKNKKLTTEERQQILTEIYSLSHQTGNLDLNVGNIKVPSIYEIRRAIGLGKNGIVPAAAQNTTVNHSATVNVYVNGKGDVWAVGKALDEHLGTSVRSAMRARGVIG